MPNSAANILLSFPPRRLGPTERSLVDEWVSRAGDIPLAYVSERRSDDPRLHHRIVIVTGPEDRPSYTVHAPSAGDAWLVSQIGDASTVEKFDTLRDALNRVRRVLP